MKSENKIILFVLGFFVLIFLIGIITSGSSDTSVHEEPKFEIIDMDSYERFSGDDLIAIGYIMTSGDCKIFFSPFFRDNEANRTECAWVEVNQIGLDDILGKNLQLDFDYGYYYDECDCVNMGSSYYDVEITIVEVDEETYEYYEPFREYEEYLNMTIIGFEEKHDYNIDSHRYFLQLTKDDFICDGYDCGRYELRNVLTLKV